MANDDFEGISTQVFQDVLADLDQGSGQTFDEDSLVGDVKTHNQDWLYRHDDRVHGPVSASVLASFLDEGRFADDLSIARPNGTWRFVSDVPQFHKVVNTRKARLSALAAERSQRRKNNFFALVRGILAAAILALGGLLGFVGVNTILESKLLNDKEIWLAEVPALPRVAPKPAETIKPIQRVEDLDSNRGALAQSPKGRELLAMSKTGQQLLETQDGTKEEVRANTLRTIDSPQPGTHDRSGEEELSADDATQKVLEEAAREAEARRNNSASVDGGQAKSVGSGDVKIVKTNLQEKPKTPASKVRSSKGKVSKAKASKAKSSLATSTPSKTVIKETPEKRSDTVAQSAKASTISGRAPDSEKGENSKSDVEEKSPKEAETKTVVVKKIEAKKVEPKKDVILDELKSSDMKKGFMKSARYVKKCIERQMEQDEEVPERITISFCVSNDGKPTGVSILERAAQDSPLGKCIRAAVRKKARWPKYRGEEQCPDYPIQIGQ